MQKKLQKKVPISVHMVSLFMSWLLSLFLTVAVIVTAFQIGCFNSDFFVEQFDQGNYYPDMQEYIYKSIDEYIFATGITARDAAGDSISVQQIQKDVVVYMRQVLEKGVGEVDTIELEEKIYQNLLLYMEKNGIEKNENNLSDIRELSKDICQEYAKLVRFPFLSYYANVVRVFAHYKILIFIVCGVLVLFVSILLMLLYMPDCFQVCRYYIYALSAAIIMGGILPTYVLGSEIYTRIQLSPEYLYRFMVNFVRQSMLQFYIPLVAYIVLLVTIAIVWYCHIVHMRKQKSLCVGSDKDTAKK